ncbi:MAG: hypothetical protein ACQ5SW_04540 [Sphaerochaetaceae bacterium]
MRTLFRYPQIEAARTAASYKLLSEDALFAMGVSNVEEALLEMEYEIVFRSGNRGRYPHLKVYKQQGKLWWIIVGVGMYPDHPQLSDEVAGEVLKHAPLEKAKVYFAPVMFINTRSQNISLPSQNGSFTALFNGLIPVTKHSHS